MSHDRGVRTLERVAGLAAAGWGAALLVKGPDIWTAVDGRRPDGTDEAAVRFLGVRHLAQGALQAALPGRFSPLFIGIDVIHAASMFWLAAVDEPRRRPALVSGSAAMATAILTAAGRRRT